MKINVAPLSENTLLVVLNQQASRENIALLSYLSRQIKAALGSVIIDIVPAYASLHITFNLLKISGAEIRRVVNAVLDRDLDLALGANEKTVLEIPVYYGEEVAPDLLSLAQTLQLSPEEVVRRHANRLYDVYAIGFSPGFAYLGYVDPSIACPRKSTPRPRVAQGSVAIADRQTAVYPLDSPGGWQIIGRTPMAMVDFQSDRLTPLAVGAQVRFIAIDCHEYKDLGGRFL